MTFLLACALVEGSEFALERLMESDNQEAVGTFFVLTGLYQRLLTAARIPEVRRTVIVEVNPEKDFASVSNSNVCAEREFLAHLIRRIDENSSPAAIVIDKYFGKSACLNEDGQGTRDLIETVDSIRHKGHKVVIGLETQKLEDAQNPPRGMPESFLVDSLKFGAGSMGQEGIVNIAHDTRRLPLQWQIYSSQDGGAAITLNTLSMTAALAYDPDLLAKDRRLAGLIDDGEQPFIGFLGEKQWADAHGHFYASEVLCGRRAAESEQWRSCEGQGPVPARLDHQIVLIGEQDRADRHDSVVGPVPGFYLQANYIEALLDSQYLNPGGRLANYGLGFAFLIALELILIVLHERAGWAIAGIALLAAVSYAGLLLIVLVLRTYVDPIPVGATGCAIKILHLVYGKVALGHSPEHT